MTGPEHYKLAETQAERAYHYIYGDGADPATGHAFAAMAQVHATLALAAASAGVWVQHSDHAADDWGEVLSS